jgi:hypothetical protein
VALVTPVNWETGWVEVIANLGMNGFVLKEIHISDLKADGGINEIQNESDLIEKDEQS